MVEATKELSIPTPEDQADGNAIGGYFTPHNMDPTGYRRSSAEEAYYDTAEVRENFHLIAGHQATRILTSANGTIKATGVEVRMGLLQLIYPRTDVLQIVCCLVQRDIPIRKGKKRGHCSRWLFAHASAAASVWHW